MPHDLASRFTIYRNCDDVSDMPPYLASEISARLLAVDPMIRRMFNLEEVTMTGGEMEKLCSAVWLMGYGEACGDIGEAPNGELPPLAAWMAAQ